MKTRVCFFLIGGLALGAVISIGFAQLVSQQSQLEIQKKLNISPQHLLHLRQTKQKMPVKRFQEKFFVRGGVPFIRIKDRQEIPLVSASSLIGPVKAPPPLPDQGLPQALLPYLGYIEGKGGKIPEYVDHRLVLTPVRNQKERGTCTAHAILAALEAFKTIPRDLSEEDLYHRFMIEKGSTCSTNAKDKAGYSITDAAEILSREGACEERFFPYSQDLPPACPEKHGPPEDAVKNRLYRIEDYHTIYNLGEDHPNAIALIAHNGKFVNAPFNIKDGLVADREGVGPREVFTLLPLHGQQVAIMSPEGFIVSADAGRQNLLVADRTEVREWEKFTRVPAGISRMAFKAFNGRYVSADAGKNDLLFADRESVREWESFEVVERPSRFSITNIRYLESILAAGFNIVWGAPVLWGDENKDRIMDVVLDDKGDPLVPDDATGAHSMLIVGYYQPKKYFIVKNSWGDGEGVHGYDYISYDYVKTYSLGGLYITSVSAAK